ncbi:TPA: AAA family ATPase, partial [Thermoplasmata archaeon]|nr:AAA family ATPase [Thermoplasmata archaeon]
VRGAPRRRRAYFLTEKGRRTAESIKESVLGEAVTWVGDGKPESVSVAEAIRRASVSNGRTPSVVEVVDRVRAGATLAPQDFVERASPSETPSVVAHSLGRPVVGQFFRRSEVLARLLDAVRGESVSTVLVHGMPGIGKSTLLSKVFDDLSEGRNLFWYSLSQWDTDKTVADQLASFLSSCGRRSLARAMKSTLPTAEAYSPLLSDLRGLDSVIFLDDVHKASERLELLISMLMDAARVSKSAKLVLISRTVPDYVPRDIRQSLHIELKELDRESARQLVQSSSKDVGEDVYSWAHGNPLLLTLISKKGASAERGDVISFIDSEVYSILTDGQREVLELLSAFRHPVPLSDLSEDDSREATGLRAMSLVVEQESGIWVHDLLRDYFSSRLSPEKRARAHLKASGYCATREEPEWRLEALYHLVEAGAWAEAPAFVVAKFDSLSRDFPE